MSEVISRATTADNKHVLLWDDGSLTWALGYAIRGAWMSPKPENRDRALRAGWLTLGDIELYDASEVPALVKAARYTADRNGTPGMMRQRMHSSPSPKGLKPEWTVISADSRGQPTERVWKFPRLGPWADYAVWDFGSRGGSGGRYSLHRRVSGARDTYEPTGFRFKTLAQLQRHLEEHPDVIVERNPARRKRKRNAVDRGVTTAGILAPYLVFAAILGTTWLVAWQVDKRKA